MMCAKGPQSRCPEVRCERSQRAAFIPCNLIGFSTDIASSSKGAIRGVTGHTQLQRRDALEVTCFKKVQSVRFPPLDGLVFRKCSCIPQERYLLHAEFSFGADNGTKAGTLQPLARIRFEGPGRSAPDGSDLCQKLFRRNESTTIFAVL
jgi:hypothetical protein